MVALQALKGGMAATARYGRKDVRIIVVGCGRVGKQLAEVLDTPENQVTVIDVDPAALARLSSEFQGTRVVGHGYDESVLEQAGIRECDALAAVTSLDNVNLMSSEVARRLYNVPHVLTRLINPGHIKLYQQLGLDYICDTELVAENMVTKVRARRAHHLETFGEYEVLTFTLHAPGVIHVRDLEALGEVHVALFEHDGEQFLATHGMFLHDGDTVVAVAHESALPALAEYMKGEASQVKPASPSVLTGRVGRR